MTGRAMTAAPKPCVSEEQYLAQERLVLCKSQY